MKKALPNTKVTVKLRKSNYKDEWYLIMSHTRFTSEALNRQAVWLNQLTEPYPHQFGTSLPLHESCRMEHSITNLSVI